MLRLDCADGFTVQIDGSLEELGTMRGSEEEAREAFEAEMLPHLNAAYRLARALTGQQQDAEDLVQDTYLRAFAGFKGYTRGTNARAWLLTILRRTYLNNQRRLSNRPRTFPLEEPQGLAESIDGGRPTPEDLALRTIDSQTVLQALFELPEPFRSVLALVDLEGLRYAEAAQVLGCPIGTIMSRLHRGRAEMARKLEPLHLQWEGG
jgi:RNA polymerase sigma-70 factor, ECF subfamily